LALDMAKEVGGHLGGYSVKTDHTAVQIINCVSPKSCFWENCKKQS